MLASRTLLSRVAVADVVLFVLASAFNDGSSTSADGILWWVAIGVFLLLLLAGTVILVQFALARARGRRFRRPRAR